MQAALLDAGSPTGGVWRQLRFEAQEACVAEPLLTRLFREFVLDRSTLESALFHRLAARLRSEVVPPTLILDAFKRASDGHGELRGAIEADITAVLERDAACTRLIEPFLYFKGFHALQAHRLAHWLHNAGERDFALYLQSRSSEVFQTDIHPAASIGCGVFLDHATGLVVGETAVVENDVSLLQDVTLGGTGKHEGDRHPKLRRGAMVGAGAKILGNIEIGEYARVAAGSIVLRSVPPLTTVAGVPAKPVGAVAPEELDRNIKDRLEELAYSAFDYSI